GSIAVLTCLVGNLYWWTLWNGVISYVLMGLLMGGEWLIRQRLRKRV
ncbi:DNA gyrase subunit B, partial [Pectobacterium carotovorum]|nr:DNA gyrase subunit B [Pectobacterium carotovorum]